MSRLRWGLSLLTVAVRGGDSDATTGGGDSDATTGGGVTTTSGTRVDPVGCQDGHCGRVGPQHEEARCVSRRLAVVFGILRHAFIPSVEHC